MTGFRWVLAAFALALPACIVDTTPPTGDLALRWSFAGEGCSQAQIATVSVTLFDAAGNAFVDDTFPCSAGGATYQRLETGSYGFDLNGFSAGGTRLYEAAGSVDVHHGSNDFAIDLTIPR